MTERPTAARHDEAAVEKVLRGWGVHRGFPEQRKALAAALSTNPIEFSEKVCRALYIEAKEARGAKRPASMIAGWLEDGSWVELWEDMRHSEDHIAESMRDDESKPVNWMLQQERTREAEQQYDACYAYARLCYERRSVADVADELGVSIDRVPSLARAGAEAFGRDPLNDYQLRCALDPAFAESEQKRKLADMKARRAKPGTLGAYEQGSGEGARRGQMMANVLGDPLAGDQQLFTDTQRGKIVDDVKRRFEERDKERASGCPSSDRPPVDPSRSPGPVPTFSGDEPDPLELL